MEIDTQPLSRRGLVAGGAAIGAGTLLTAALAGSAHAGPGDPAAPLGKGFSPMSDPGGPRINTAPVGGYSYLFRNWMDFRSLDSGARAWDGQGSYATAGTGQFLATGQLPPGAILRDVEWYFSSSVATSLGTYIWTTGSTNIAPINTIGVPVAPAGLRMLRSTFGAAVNGPYAHGAMIVFYLTTNATTKINGVRLGYSSGPSGTVMLPTPVRAYDSRSGAKIGNGQTRIHSLASYIPAGATAAIVNLTATSGEKSGGLAIYNTGSSLPSGSLVYYNGGTTESNEVHCKLPSDRKVKVTMRGVSGCKVHYFIDVLGYTA